MIALFDDAGGVPAILARALDFAGLAGAFGACVFRLAVVRGDAWSERVTARFGLAAAAIALVAIAARVVIQAMAFAVPGEPLLPTLQVVLGTEWGIRAIVQAAWLMLAMVAFAGAFVSAGAPRATGRRALIWWSAAAVASGFASLSLTFMGHAISREPSLAASIFADAAHVLAAGGWAGAVGALAWVASRPTMQSDRAETLAVLIERFRPLALSAAATLFLSGAVSAWLRLGSVAALYDSNYGRILIIKLAVIAAAAALGRQHSLTAATLVRAGLGAAVAKSIAVEGWLLLVVLAVTALLAGSPLPGE